MVKIELKIAFKGKYFVSFRVWNSPNVTFSCETLFKPYNSAVKDKTFTAKWAVHLLRKCVFCKTVKVNM